MDDMITEYVKLKSSAEKDDDEDTITHTTISTHSQGFEALETAMPWFEGQPEANYTFIMVWKGEVFSSFKRKEEHKTK